MIIKRVCKNCEQKFQFVRKAANFSTRIYCDKCKRRHHYYGRLTECKLCHSKNNIHTHHMLDKQNNKKDTLLGLCKKCHRFITSYHNVLRGRNFKIVRDN